MTRCRTLAAAALAGALSYGVTPHAEAPRAAAPHVYAITGARLVTAAGPPIQRGTLVIRDGLIEAVGAGAQAPADAVVVDGEGLAVYPGLIDMGNAAGLDAAPPAAPAAFDSLEDAERYKRRVILRSELQAAEALRPDAPELARLAGAGITSVLARPASGLFKGQSALVNVAAPDDEPQIGAVADVRKGLQVVRAPVALHVSLALPGGRGGPGYPVSLLGSIAFVRQTFLDAQHYRLAQERYPEATPSGPRPAHDASLAALQPALDRSMPVVFDAELAREILRALDMARQFNLDPVIDGGREAGQVAEDLKSRNARVIYSLDFPERSPLLAPDADEPLRELRARAEAPRTPGELEKAGILFAFASDGLAQPRDFLRHAARAVQEGLPEDAAVRALTINAARIAGAETRLGTLEPGKIANVIVTSGGLFEPATRIVHTFVDGRRIPPAPAASDSRPSAAQKK